MFVVASSSDISPDSIATLQREWVCVVLSEMIIGSADCTQQSRFTPRTNCIWGRPRAPLACHSAYVHSHHTRALLHCTHTHTQRKARGSRCYAAGLGAYNATKIPPNPKLTWCTLWRDPSSAITSSLIKLELSAASWWVKNVLQEVPKFAKFCWAWLACFYSLVPMVALLLPLE